MAASADSTVVYVNLPGGDVRVVACAGCDADAARSLARLAAHGLAYGRGAIVVEPLGRDLASARQIIEEVGRVFNESQIFRIDHYLGKEAVQNLIYFRFANTFLEPIWNRAHVRSMQVTMAENIGVEGRGRFYEEAGAIATSSRIICWSSSRC